MLLQKIRNDSSFSSLQGDKESMQRLYELDKHFVHMHQSKKTSSYTISDNRLFLKYLKRVLGNVIQNRKTTVVRTYFNAMGRRITEKT